MTAWNMRKPETPPPNGRDWESYFVSDELSDEMNQLLSEMAGSFRREDARQDFITVFQRMDGVYKRSFPEYQVYWNVGLGEIVEDAPGSFKPIHFLFVKDREPVLAVVITTANGIRCRSVVGTQKWLQAAGIGYMRFLVGDSYYTNTAEYIYRRTRDALEEVGA